MWIRVAVASAALVSWGSPLHAQTVLTEAEALARLSADGVYGRAAQAAVDVARAEERQAGLWPNPVANFAREGAAGVTETMTTVVQPLPITGRLALERQAAAALTQAAAGRADEVLRRARADLRLAYAELAAAQAREAELTRTRDRLNELVTALDRRVAAGDAAGFDRLRAAREVLEADVDLRTVAADRVRARGALGALIGGGLDQDLRVDALPTTTPNLPPVAMLAEQARRTRGELRALAQDREAARVSALVARTRRLPEPEIFGGAKTSSVGTTGSVLGVQATWPLFNRGSADRSVAEARIQQAERRLMLTGQAIDAQVASARAASVERHAAATEYRAMAAITADELERIARVSYDAGERGILELVDAHRAASQSRQRQVALDLAARQADIELEYVSGWEVR
jgi:cobalt-zinc-cadmium efflux system outer membrane protein